MTDLLNLVERLRLPDFWVAYSHGDGKFSDRIEAAPFQAADTIEVLYATLEEVGTGVRVATVASCDCDTKSSEPQHHDDSCRYKLFWHLSDIIIDALAKARGKQ